MPEISEDLANALAALVRASEAAELAPAGRQEARRAIEAATVVAQLARDEGFRSVRRGANPADEKEPRGPGRFVPADFSPPTRLDTPSFRLRPLTPEHNERDHAAWMGSVDHIHATPGFADAAWPRPMSLDENRADLQRHHDDFRDRVGFTYTVLEADGPADRADVIGCVYIYPDDHPGTDVHVRSWVRADHADLDNSLATTVRAWLEDAWPWRPDRIRDHPRDTAR